MNKVIQGDCLEKLKDLEDNSVDSIVTDPPYHLVSIVKRFGKEGSAPAKEGKDGSFKRLSGGFMGKTWDGVDENGKGIAYNVDMWKECLRVLKPGGHLLAFGGTRTYHRMASAIEDAGFEVRDMIEWVYSTGFPKSLNVYKHLQKKCKCGNMEVYENRIKQMGKDSEAETEYFLRFMQEADLSQTISPEKKQGKVLQSGLSEQSSHRTVQGEEPEESSKGREERVLERGNNTKKTEGELQGSDLSEMPERVFSDGEERRIHNATQVGDGSAPKQTINENGSSASQRPQSEQQQYREPCAFCKQWGTQAIRTLGVGTALKPAHEPICMARKPLAEKTVAENCLKYGTGGINIDESRVDYNGETPNVGGRANHTRGDGYGFKELGDKIEANTQGRFPANLIHDGSDEVVDLFPDSGGGKAKHNSEIIRKGIKQDGSPFNSENSGFDVNKCQGLANFGDSGSAARFFYCAKASKAERNRGCEGLEEKIGGSMCANTGNTMDLGGASLKGEKKQIQNTKNNHPTVKPIALMEYLIKMVTPKGGIVLDPFAGSGSTLVAAKQNGFQYIGIELTEEYIPIIEARLNALNQYKLL